VSGRIACRSLLWLIALCAALSLTAQAGQATGPLLHLTDAWIRWLPGATPAGGYVTLVNESDVPWTLTGASSDDYGSVTLHQSREEHGVSSMTPVEALIIAPHSTLVLGDQGYHLMLMQPSRPLKPGDDVRIDLRFANGRQVGTSFHVRSPDMLINK
jgi:periplasmic copper chaperone A